MRARPPCRLQSIHLPASPRRRSKDDASKPQVNVLPWYRYAYGFERKDAEAVLLAPTADGTLPLMSFLVRRGSAPGRP